MTGYSKEYFENRGPEQKDARMLIQWLEHTNPKTLFDFGCGTGKMVHLAIENGLDAVGYDPNITQEQIFGLASNRVVKELPAGNILHDLVLMIDVMEHLENEEQVDKCIEDIKRLCGKWVIFSITDLSLWFRYVDPTHKFCRTRTWWENKLSKHFDLIPTPSDWLYKDQLYLGAVRK